MESAGWRWVAVKSAVARRAVAAMRALEILDSCVLTEVRAKPLELLAGRWRQRLVVSGWRMDEETRAGHVRLATRSFQTRTVSPCFHMGGALIARTVSPCFHMGGALIARTVLVTLSHGRCSHREGLSCCAFPPAHLPKRDSILRPRGSPGCGRDDSLGSAPAARWMEEPRVMNCARTRVSRSLPLGTYPRSRNLSRYLAYYSTAVCMCTRKAGK